MKYVFAGILVLLALVMVFHAEKLVPIPRTVGRIMNSAAGEHMPFGIKAAYAESCLAGLETEQHRVRYAVSDATVRSKCVERRITSLREARDQSVTRIRSLLANKGDVSEQVLAAEVARHDDLQWKLAHAEETRDRVTSALESLESAEGSVSRKRTALHDRLDIVQLDHVRNNARELAAELADSDHSGAHNRPSYCSEVIEHLEHKERVREEFHHRYGAVPARRVQDSVRDCRARANEIVQSDF